MTIIQSVAIQVLFAAIKNTGSAVNQSSQVVCYLRISLHQVLVMNRLLSPTSANENLIVNHVTVDNESPSIVPTLISPNFANFICQYGGYCIVDSDCVVGNRCQVQSQYYNECIPDSSSGSDSNKLFRQCSQPTTGCLNPLGFTSPSSSPTNQIGGAGLYPLFKTESFIYFVIHFINLP